MVGNLRILSLAILLTTALAAPSWSGEDVTLSDSAGNTLKHSQIEMVDYKKTCGNCHDVADKAASVHFNRESDSLDAQSGDCFSCHLSTKPSAFSSSGTIDKLSLKPSNAACESCHSSMQDTNVGNAHNGMTCVDCHQNAGHRALSSPSCVGCHNAKSTAPKPLHRGFTALHIKKIACETCHAGRSDHSGNISFAIRNGRILPIDTETPIHHDVAVSSLALGATGCQNCHSNTSQFFFGANGGSIPNYRAMGLTRKDIMSGDIRERLVKPLSVWLFVIIFALSALHYAIFGPHRVKMVRGEPSILRFTIYERIVHWLTTASFAFLAITGVAFLLHLETPDGRWRGIHGQVGAIFMISLVGMLVIWWKNARFTPCDIHWLRRFGGYLWLRGSCPAEKFNAGQKLFFWLIVFCTGILMCATGWMLVHGKGSAASWTFTLHDIAAVIMIAGILGHLYLSVFANQGSISGILTGRVTRSWVTHHHPIWLLHIEPGSKPTEHTDSKLI
ncbi:MAG: cytochrome b/b6 domain-containing protein [Armatimonadetes bacterium]|nr:cytochrome b/b6 domain-containing protein [Armatimonadota bacterium]